MQRREFITLIGGAAAWPLAARAQQPERMRRVGVLMPFPPNDDEGQARFAAFVLGLQKRGWVEGKNLRMDTYWVQGSADRLQASVKELMKQTPEVILVSNVAVVAALRKETRAVPTVFAQVIDPVGQGFVQSLAHPGENITGFTNFKSTMPGKWLELVKDIAPRVARALLIYHPETTPHAKYILPVEAAGRAIGLAVNSVGVRQAADIDAAIKEFTPEPNGSLIIMPSGPTAVHRQLIVDLASRYRLPAIYPFRYFVKIGGLISYGIDTLDPYRRAAGYVDRILKGATPADLPVQQPVKFELVINLKSAKVLGLKIPDRIVAIADEVVE